MREGEDNSGDETADRHRDSNREEGVDPRGAEAGRGAHGLLNRTFKRALQRLDHEGEGIDHRPDDQPHKGKAQCVAGRREPEAAKRRIRTHRDQEIKAENGRRQDQREGD